jgi:FkbM family methyltransferase
MTAWYLPSFLFRCAHNVGLQASRVGTYYEFAQLCMREKVDTVFDVGANRGQFASRIRAAGWTGATVSFEPIADLNRRLVAAAARDPKWVIADPIALGAQQGRLALNIASNDGLSSSFLDVKEEGHLYKTSFEFTHREEVFDRSRRAEAGRPGL